jgi:hypothetical protein
MSTCGAEVLVANLKAQGVKHVFGVPGAKIDRVFDSLVDSGIETVSAATNRTPRSSRQAWASSQANLGLFGHVGSRLYEPGDRICDRQFRGHAGSRLGRRRATRSAP